MLLLTLLVSLISATQGFAASVGAVGSGVIPLSPAPSPRKEGKGTNILEAPPSLRGRGRLYSGAGWGPINDNYAVLGPEAPAILHVLIGDTQVLVIQPETLATVLKQCNVSVFILPQDWADDTDLKVAQAARIKIVYVQRHVSIAAIEANIRMLATLTDTQSAGERWIRTIDDGLAHVRQNVSRYPISRVLILTPEGYTQGQGTLITDLLRYVGGINVAAEAGIPEARQLDDSQIRQFEPEVVLLIGWTPQDAMTLALNPVYRGIPPFDHDRIYRIAPPGKDPASLVEDASTLASLIHPLAF